MGSPSRLQIFTCKGCEKQFSVTSGTIFHNRKLPIRTILLAIALYTNGAKGKAALQLSHEIGVSYKTAFVLAHKIREAIGAETKNLMVSGVVEIDGAYSGGKVKKKNEVEDRVDRRLAENQNGKRRVVIIVRERGGRCIPFVERAEADAIPTLIKHIKPGSLIHADEATSWDPLQYYGFDMLRVNHKERYYDFFNHACTNQAESYFSRYRRSEIGIHHHFAGPYLEAYALEMAWREDTRRISNGVRFLLIGLEALTHPPSPIWKGYWQRSRKTTKKGSTP